MAFLKGNFNSSGSHQLQPENESLGCRHGSLTASEEVVLLSEL